MKYCSIITLTILLLTNSANAQQKHETYGKWSVFTVNKEGRKLCYATSFPIKKNGNYRSRSQPYVMVTAIDNNEYEFSVTGGYKYKANTEPRINIDGQKYKISLTRGEIAWAKTDKYDRILIDKMKAGSKMKVTGTSIIGTYSIDTYSLSGFTKAYNKIANLCS